MINQLELKSCLSQFLLIVLTKKTSVHRNQHGYHWLLPFSTLDSQILQNFPYIYQHSKYMPKRFLVVAYKVL